MGNLFSLPKEKQPSLKEIWSTFGEKKYYFNNFENEPYEKKGDFLIPFNDVTGNPAYQVELQCNHNPQNGGYDVIKIEKVQNDSGETARLLPYKNGECYGVHIFKHPDKSMYLLTPSLQGCSIHVIDTGTTYLVLHDARAVHISQERTRRREDILGYGKFISFEYANCGYQLYIGATEEIVENINEAISCANVMLHYEQERGWMMKVQSFMSTGGALSGHSEICLNELFSTSLFSR